MRVLLLSFYFEPDLCAGSFRNTAFVDSLKRTLPAGSEIEVLTTLPNRYSGYRAEAAQEESFDCVTVRRVLLPTHKSGMADQARSFLTYAAMVRRTVAKKDYDVVFASSSRLMTAALASWVARKKRIPLYLDIRDIFVDTIKDVLPRKLAWLMKPIFGQVERLTISRANKLNVVSAGFIDYFESKYPAVPIVVFTNGIDHEFIQHQPSSSIDVDAQAGDRSIKQQEVEVLYAGNIGEGQGLHNVMPALAQKLEGRVRFRIIGGGGRLVQLQDAIASTGCRNVVIEPPVNRAALIEAYTRADVLFLHLNDYDAFKKVLPSKLFEYGALGKPILAGVAGYSASFIEEHLSNAQVFPPCDASAGVEAYEKLDVMDSPRPDFIAEFERGKIMDAMAEDLVALVGAKP